MATKEETLARIRAAIRGSTEVRDIPSQPPSGLAPSATVDLVEEFCSALNKIGGRATRVGSTDEIFDHINKVLVAHKCSMAAVSNGRALTELAVRDWLSGNNVRVIKTLREFADVDADKAGPLMEQYKSALLPVEVGITEGDFGIADTGTLVIVTGAEQHRLISLLPPIHICLLDSRRIVPNLSEFIKMARRELYSSTPPQAITFITGTSRTADIELTLTMGVHGPRELHVLVRVA